MVDRAYKTGDASVDMKNGAKDMAHDVKNNVKDAFHEAKAATAVRRRRLRTSVLASGLRACSPRPASRCPWHLQRPL